MGSEIKTRTARIWLDPDGIVRVRTDDGASNSLDDARAHIEAVSQLLGGRRGPVMVDVRKAGPIEREVRQFYTGPETGRVSVAVALLIDSPLSRVLASFFMGLNKSPIPYRAFTSEDEALSWLRTQAA